MKCWVDWRKPLQKVCTHCAPWLVGMDKGAPIIAMAASHHRLANIIPFPKAT
jgi:hypothetical protein